MDNVLRFLDKVLSVVVDRRFWFTVVLPFLVITTTLPEEELKPYVEAVYLILSTLLLNMSWTTRPPSGLDWKGTGEKVLKKLRDAGVDV